MSLMALAGALRVAGADTEDGPAPVEAVLVYETGPAAILQNDGEYGAIGTRYDADEVGQQDNLVRVSRTSLELARGNHRVIVLYAPFAITTEVRLSRELQFKDTLLAAGTPVAHRYLFDGYRGSYLYRLVARESVTLEVGGSLQIRNAEVAFRSLDGAQRVAENDIGVVTAAKARLWYRPGSRRWWAGLEADGFSTFGLVSGVRGAIYDVQLMAGRPVARGIDLVFGARLVGGGADVESKDIYNWANFLSFTVGARISLERFVGPAPRTDPDV